MPSSIVSSFVSPNLIVICGSTASGKTGLAIAVAQHLGERGMDAVILSADSRQVYREFTIGTAKPSSFEQTLAPHFLVDICEPTQTFTAAEFQQMGQAIVTNCHQQNQVPILVGGTGLYIRSIVRGMKIPRVAAQPELRQQLSDLGQPLCYAMLQQVDPLATKKIHVNDQVRTLRALEVFYVTGQPLSQQQGEAPPNYPILQIGLDTATIDARIAQRTRKMFEVGFVEEVQGLVQKYGEALPLLNTLGYAEVRQYLRGEISLEQAEHLTVLHTRQFAKRQRTWFRGTAGIEWWDSNAADLIDGVCDRVDRFLQETNAPNRLN